MGSPHIFLYRWLYQDAPVSASGSGYPIADSSSRMVAISRWYTAVSDFHTSDSSDWAPLPRPVMCALLGGGLVFK